MRANTRVLRSVAIVAITVPLVCCRATPSTFAETEFEIRELLRVQVEAWNRGDLEGFAQTYEKSPNLVFRGPRDLTTGWDAMLARYRRGYPDRAAMGTLRFQDLECHILADGVAIAHGHWQLTRKDDSPSGYFAIVLQRGTDGWRIVVDCSG
ncbi:MAG: nuclear transport factor 2 family protein [Planctomycetes bacterium]|nr:nuclear transport factor 2 family protein [Planctomycetota bacterium]MCB9919530.1 nuclear transport factor 2 family protein [Planctomycetota bacterium]